ncbi:MAG TPA: hypothetical protein VFU55_00270 [Terracidiphilus sp.]|nr:hypothetical protein [Terracidiphilus sp.]
MFCSGCGQPVVPGQPVCSQCGRPVAPPVPPIPNFEFQLQTYAGRIRALGIVWFVYAGLELLFGLIGMTFASPFLMHSFGPWGHGFDHGPLGPGWFGPALIHFIWAIILVRVALALIAGWGLMERAPWGRVVAIVAAVFSLIKFPLGTAMGIWTLVTLLGYRNSTLYDQL